jgi:hypothetical protein
MAEPSTISAVIKESGPFFDYLFTGKGRRSRINAVVKNALNAGGTFWIGTFMMMRFSDYARRLGYRATKRWEDRKRRILGSVTPYVGITGSVPQRGSFSKMIDSVSGAKVVSANTKTRSAKLVVTVPFGHPVSAVHAQYFKRIPQWEMKRVVEVVGEAIDAALINEPTSRPPVRGTTAKRSVTRSRKRAA